MVYLSFPKEFKQKITDLSLKFLETDDFILVSYTDFRPHLISSPISPLVSHITLNSLVFTPQFEDLKRVY